jgi:hypothetical protein
MVRPWRVLALLSTLAVTLACESPTTPAPAAPSTIAMAASAADIDLDIVTPEGTLGAGVQTPVVGVVSRVSGACPDLTFVLSGVTIHVSSGTSFEGGGCSDLKGGMRAGALGRQRADGSIDARRVKVGATPPPPVTGIVASLSGACPALTFVLDGVTVRTGSITVFEGGTCSDLENGMRAGAIGPGAADGVLKAEHVRIAPAPLPAVSGTIASVSGTCPVLAFVIEQTRVHTSAKTVFDGCVCADVIVGVRGGAMGPRRTDGSIDAEKVRIAK